MADVEHCQFYLERKKRYCRMTVKKDKRFCGEHQSNYNELNKIINERIPCPLDLSHTIYKSKLSKHLKVCNAKVNESIQPIYIVKGINLGKSAISPNEIRLPEIDQSIINIVLNKIEKSYDKLPEIPEEILKHEVLEKELSNPIYGTEAKKHLLQASSLLGHLAQADLINDNTCFIEFGAGRGKLTYWLVQMIKDRRNTSVVLIDRSSHRHKRDNKLKNEKFEINVTRVRADIGDINLNDIPAVSDMPVRVAFAKHICGAGADLTFRCMTNLIKNCNGSKVGIVVAFCCHHRCEYSHYVGHNYLENEGFTKDEFPILFKIASWATCGIKQYNKTDSKRESIGRKSKTLINWGRLEYLKSFGFNGRLVYYITRDTTLENMCIIATFIRKNPDDN
ncbi:PREDICTED: tRNA:m(4)X modification enzyme TRM13 homolog [Ceratosolen solmsi marchali]|uniref:tRNA:m(4)X modification enzyme TRM13 n=1 Tax=Ceratosolen solmsi marchali TaxID=326594 RepID=A0AAJ7DYT2_9HYME|nr:PREDICTED: tRNA:m(4)X modification enzyme TRM13 homolog [Ceratosolen solmsi marchali]